MCLLAELIFSADVFLGGLPPDRRVRLMFYLGVIFKEEEALLWHGLRLDMRLD